MGTAIEPPSAADQHDDIICLSGFTWADYERLLEIRGDRSAPRITYLEGTVEIMSPSRYHENIKGKIGCLVEAWCLRHGVTFGTYGSWTIQEKKHDRGAEPDECYVFGDVEEPVRPDLAIEVIWSSGGLNKLEVYRKLRVREVWIWKRGVLQPYGLRGEAYEALPGSEVLPGLDLAQLASFIDRSPTSRAILDYRAALEASG